MPAENIAIEPFLHCFDNLRIRTLRVYDRVPPDRLEWRPGPERFSFGNLTRHLDALERHMYGWDGPAATQATARGWPRATP